MDVDPKAFSQAVAACRRLIGAGDLEAAREAARQVQDVVPRDESTWRTLLDLSRKLQLAAWSEVMTDRFIQVTGGTRAVFVERAAIAQGASDPAKARKFLERALAMGLDTPDLWFRAAVVYSDLRDVTDALAAAQRGLDLAPDDFRFRTQMVDLLRRNQQPRRARRALHELATLAGDRLGNWLAIGRHAQLLKDTAVLQTAAGRCAALIEGERPARQAAALELIHAAGRPSILRDALSLLLEAPIQDLTTAENIFGLAFRAGQHDLARAWGARILAIAPDSPYVLAQLRIFAPPAS